MVYGISSRVIWFMELVINAWCCNVAHFYCCCSFSIVLKRKESGKWGTPKVPKSLKVGYGVITLIVILGIVFPLFGVSIVVITLVETLRTKQKIT